MFVLCEGTRNAFHGWLENSVIVDRNVQHLRHLRNSLSSDRHAIAHSHSSVSGRQELELLSLRLGHRATAKGLASGHCFLSQPMRGQMPSASSSFAPLKCANWELLQYCGGTATKVDLTEHYLRFIFLSVASAPHPRDLSHSEPCVRPTDSSFSAVALCDLKILTICRSMVGSNAHRHPTREADKPGG